MSESGKWRSGREAVRTGRLGLGPSYLRGETPRALGDEEGVAAQDNRDVMVPAGVAASLVVVQTQLALDLLVHALGAVALLDATDELLHRDVLAERREVELGGRLLAA